MDSQSNTDKVLESIYKEASDIVFIEGRRYQMIITENTFKAIIPQLIDMKMKYPRMNPGNINFQNLIIYSGLKSGAQRDKLPFPYTPISLYYFLAMDDYLKLSIYLQKVLNVEGQNPFKNTVN